MSATVILVFCTQALFIQLAFSACAGRSNLGAGLASCGLSTPITPGLGTSGYAGPLLSTRVLPTLDCSGLSYNGIGFGNSGIGYGAGASCGGLTIEVIPISGGSLPVCSSSPISPTGLSVVSDNVIEGNLYVGGELPFVSALVLESVLPSGGAGTISYSCGNGVTANKSIAPSYAAAIAPIAPAHWSPVHCLCY